MAKTRDEYKKRIIARADSEGDIFTLEDGFYYFGPSTGGAMSAELLRVIADELDRRNEGWASLIEEYFAPIHTLSTDSKSESPEQSR